MPNRFSRVYRLTMLICVVVCLQGSESLAAETERVSVVSVEVPVQVTLSGNPLRGLTRGQFVILSGGKEQEITSFREIDVALLQTEDPGRLDPHVPMAGRRHFLIVFDLALSSAGSIARARKHVLDWFGDSLHSTDLVAVATYSGTRGPQLLLNFTSDRNQAMLAIANLGMPVAAVGGSDPLGLAIGRSEGDTFDSAYTQGRLDGSYLSFDDDNVGNALRDIYDGSYEPLANQGRRQPIRRLGSQFGALARLLNSVKGRKHVVFLSEGFDASLVFAEDDAESVELMNTAVESGEIWRVDSAKRFGSGPTRTILLDMLEEFRKADCVIQAVDLKGLGLDAGERVLPSSSDGLFLLANETGGEVYRSFSNLGKALDSVLSHTSVTYLLSFSPKSTDGDGKFHRLKVKLKDAPKKARVTHRPGYFGSGSRGAVTAEQRRLVVGERILEGREGGEIATSLLAAPYRFAEGTSVVPILMEIDGADLMASTGPRVAAEIYVYAFDIRGGLADFLTQTVNLDLSRPGAALGRGLKFYGELELVPGEYSLRALVVQRGGTRSGLNVVSLVVPAFDETEPVLLPPMFPEPRGRWLLAREARLAGGGATPFPFTLRDAPYMPAARPTVERQSSTVVYLPAYDLADGPLALVGDLYGVAGSRAGSMVLDLVERVSGEQGRPDTLVVVLRTGDLGVGEYTLVMTLFEETTGRRAKTSTPLTLILATGS